MGAYHKVSYRKTVVEVSANKLLHRVIEIALSNRVPLSKIKHIVRSVKHGTALVCLKENADELVFKTHLEGKSRDRSSRYFIDDDLLFRDGGYTYALTKSWEIDEVKRIVLLLADRFPHLHLEWST